MDKNGEWRRFHNEEVPSLYRSPNIVSAITRKSRRLRWTGNVARIEERRRGHNEFRDEDSSSSMS